MPKIRQVHRIIHLFLSGVSGSCTTLFAYPWQGYHRAQVGKSGPRIPFTQPSFEGIACRPSPTMRKNSVVTTSLVYTTSRRFLVYRRGKRAYSHQRPGCSGCFVGRCSAEERFLGRLRGWHRGGRDPRLWGDSGQRVVSSRPDSGMSKPVGGHSARLTAAASGGAASISSLVSGQAARGWGCTGPGFSPPAILPSLTGPVNDTFLVSPEGVPVKWSFFVSPEGDPEKESRWDRWRAGEERPDPEKESRRDLRIESCGCWVGPVYISAEIQRGPGQISVLNCDWLSAWDAADAASAGRSGDASPGHASLTRVTRLFQAGF